MHYTMKMSIPLAAMLILMSGVVFAYAQDDSIEIQAGVRVETPTPRPRPLQLLHDKRIELQQNARDAVKEIRQDAKNIRADVRLDIKAATTGAERRDILKDAREDRADVRASIKTRLQGAVRANLGAAINRLHAATKGFDSLISRMESRIEKLKGRGIDATSVEATLSTAVSLTATAKADAEALSSIIGSVSDESDVASVKAQIRSGIEKATASTKAAHQALLKAAQELSALVRANAGSAEASGSTTVDAGTD